MFEKEPTGPSCDAHSQPLNVTFVLKTDYPLNPTGSSSWLVCPSAEFPFNLYFIDDEVNCF